MRIKKAIFTVAALAALSCAVLTAGCEHTRDGRGSSGGSGTGGDTGTGSGGTIDSGGSMDQGRGTYGTGRDGNGSGAE